MQEYYGAFWEKFKAGYDKTRRYITTYDAYGIPIVLSYKGEDTYKTFCGALCTLFTFAIVMTYVATMFDKLVNLDNPSYAFYRMITETTQQTPLNLPDNYGQIYIGMRQSTDVYSGERQTIFVPFEKQSVDVKVNYYEKQLLMARKDLEYCDWTEREEFAEKVDNSNGVFIGDWPRMYCIPREKFSLYNVAGSTEINSIAVLFDQCGGKYSYAKEFQEDVEAERLAQIEAGIPEDQLTAVEWKWGGDDVDPRDLGLQLTEEDIARIAGARNVYADCPNTESFDEKKVKIQCGEFWDDKFTTCANDNLRFKCADETVKAVCSDTYLRSQVLNLFPGATPEVISKQVPVERFRCQLFFLRGLCYRFENRFEGTSGVRSPMYEPCGEEKFQTNLKPETNNNCYPGMRYCLGYSDMWGEPKTQDCKPYNITCTLFDQLDNVDLSAERNSRPLLRNMPQSSLTLDESDELDELTELLYKNLWYEGTRKAEYLLSDRERNEFWNLGSEIMGPKGFNEFYQSQTISPKLQEEIDASVRTFILISRNRGLDSPFMPLSKISAKQWEQIFTWLNDKYSSQVFKKAVMYEDPVISEVQQAYDIGQTFLGDRDLFLIAYYEAKKVLPYRQLGLDAAIRSYYTTNLRKAKDTFPLTTLTDTEWNDIIRAMQINTITKGSNNEYWWEKVLADDYDPATSVFSFTDDIRIFSTVSYMGTTQLIDSIMLAIKKTVGTNSVWVDVPRVQPTALQTQIQGDIDTALKAFLQNNNFAMQTDNAQEATVSLFVQSTLKVREYDAVWRASMKQLCIDGYPKLAGAPTDPLLMPAFCAKNQNLIYRASGQKVGDIFDKKFQQASPPLTDAQRDTILANQVQFWGFEGVYSLYYYWFSIDANQQTDIDNYIINLIPGLKRIELASMPDTTLNLNEFARLQDIMQYKLGDLWKTAMRDGVDSIKADDKKYRQLHIGGREIMGTTDDSPLSYLYEAFFNKYDKGALDAGQSSALDRRVRAFIDANVELGVQDVIYPIASIAGMEDTYLTELQDKQIREIMAIKTGQLWETNFPEPTRRQLSDSRELSTWDPQYKYLDWDTQKKLKRAGGELMGSELFAYFITGGFDQEIQNKIDEACIEFIEKNEKIKASEPQVTFTTIPKMPYSIISATEWTNIQALLNKLLPNYSDPLFFEYYTGDVKAKNALEINDNVAAAVTELGKVFFGDEAAANGLYGQWFDKDRLNFDKDEQAYIDDHLMFKLFQQYEGIDPTTKAIHVQATDPMMPKTSLSEDELADVYYIMSLVLEDPNPDNNKNGGLWQKASQFTNTINPAQYNALEQIGKKMLGSDSFFLTFFNGWKEAQYPVANVLTDLNAILTAAQAAVATSQADALAKAADVLTQRTALGTIDAAELAAKTANDGFIAALATAQSALDSAKAAAAGASGIGASALQTALTVAQTAFDTAKAQADAGQIAYDKAVVDKKTATFTLTTAQWASEAATQYSIDASAAVLDAQKAIDYAAKAAAQAAIDLANAAANAANAAANAAANGANALQALIDAVAAAAQALIDAQTFATAADAANNLAIQAVAQAQQAADLAAQTLAGIQTALAAAQSAADSAALTATQNPADAAAQTASQNAQAALTQLNQDLSGAQLVATSTASALQTASQDATTKAAALTAARVAIGVAQQASDDAQAALAAAQAAAGGAVVPVPNSGNAVATVSALFQAALDASADATTKTAAARAEIAASNVAILAVQTAFNTASTASWTTLAAATSGLAIAQANADGAAAALALVPTDLSLQSASSTAQTALAAATTALSDAQTASSAATAAALLAVQDAGTQIGKAQVASAAAIATDQIFQAAFAAAIAEIATKNVGNASIDALIQTNLAAAQDVTAKSTATVAAIAVSITTANAVPVAYAAADAAVQAQVVASIQAKAAESAVNAAKAFAALNPADPFSQAQIQTAEDALVPLKAVETTATTVSDKATGDAKKAAQDAIDAAQAVLAAADATIAAIQTVGTEFQALASADSSTRRMLIGGIGGTTGDLGADILTGVTCVFSFGTVCPDAADSGSTTGTGTNTGTNAASGAATTTVPAAAQPVIATAEAIAVANNAAIPAKPFSGNVCYSSGWCQDVTKSGITYAKAFSDADQAQVDEKLRAFIKEYLTPIKEGVAKNDPAWYGYLVVKPFDVLAVIKGMKDTTLTEPQYESVLAWLLLRLPDNYWNASFHADKLDKPIVLTAENKEYVDAVGLELFDGRKDDYDKYVTYQSNTDNFSASDQSNVDTAWKKIATAYDNAKSNSNLASIQAYEPVKCFAPILCKLMPLTAITAAEETQIIANLNTLTDNKGTDSLNNLVLGKYLPLLDDNLLMRKAYDQMLTRDGYELLIQASGARGAKKGITSKLDQKFLDYYMQDFGLQTITTALAKEVGLPRMPFSTLTIEEYDKFYRQVSWTYGDAWWLNLQNPTVACVDDTTTALECAQKAIRDILLDSHAAVLETADDFTEVQQTGDPLDLADGGIDALIKNFMNDDALSKFGETTLIKYRAFTDYFIKGMPKSKLIPQEQLGVIVAIEQMTGQRGLFQDTWMSGDITGVTKDWKDMLYQAIEEVIVGYGPASVITPDAWLSAIKDPADTAAEISVSDQDAMDTIMKAYLQAKVSTTDAVDLIPQKAAYMPESTKLDTDNSFWGLQVERYLFDTLGGLYIKVYVDGEFASQAAADQTKVVDEFTKVYGADAADLIKDNKRLTASIQATADTTASAFITQLLAGKPDALSRRMLKAENQASSGIRTDQYLKKPQSSQQVRRLSETMDYHWWSAQNNSKQETQIKAKSAPPAKRTVLPSQGSIEYVKAHQYAVKSGLELDYDEEVKHNLRILNTGTTSTTTNYSGSATVTTSAVAGVTAVGAIDPPNSDTVTCKNDEDIKKYLKDKSIVIFTTESFIDEETVVKANENEVTTYIKELAEIQLDFKYHKQIYATVEETNYEIQDRLFTELPEYFAPETQMIVSVKTTIQNTDMTTREYWDGKEGKYENTKDAMITFSMQLTSTVNKQEREAYGILSFFGDVGGLNDFLGLLITPLMGYIVGNRFSYIILRSLFMQNKGDEEEEKKDNDFSEIEHLGDANAKKQKEEDWLRRTQPYEEGWKNQVGFNETFRYFTCRDDDCGRLRREDTLEQEIFDKGDDWMNRNLDIRNIIKSQETLKSLVYLLVPEMEKRRLLRLQRRSIVLEPGSSSEDSEEDFKQYRQWYQELKDKLLKQREDDENGMDSEMKRLIAGVLDRNGLMQKKKEPKEDSAEKKAKVEEKIRKKMKQLQAQKMKEYEMNTIEVVSSRNLVQKGQESGSSAGTGAEVSQAPLAQATTRLTPGKSNERDERDVLSELEDVLEDRR